MASEHDPETRPPDEPDHDRFQRCLDTDKRALEEAMGLLENLILGGEHLLRKYADHLGPDAKEALEFLNRAGIAARDKKIIPPLKRVEAEIELVELAKPLKTGVPEEDEDLEEPPPPEIPVDPKPKPKPPKSRNGGKK